MLVDTEPHRIDVVTAEVVPVVIVVVVGRITVVDIALGEHSGQYSGHDNILTTAPSTQVVGVVIDDGHGKLVKCFQACTRRRRR